MSGLIERERRTDNFVQDTFTALKCSEWIFCVPVRSEKGSLNIDLLRRSLTCFWPFYWNYRNQIKTRYWAICLTYFKIFHKICFVPYSLIYNMKNFLTVVVNIITIFYFGWPTFYFYNCGKKVLPNLWMVCPVNISYSFLFLVELVWNEVGI